LGKWKKYMDGECGFNITVSKNVDYEGPSIRFIYVDKCVQEKEKLFQTTPLFGM